jgi:hypothetical protein
MTWKQQRLCCKADGICMSDSCVIRQFKKYLKVIIQN